MFGFDEQFAAYGTTPVDNQFILQYMTLAKGEYVKVYLYGLTRSHYPAEGMCMTQIAEALAMTENEVEEAFRYWERKGLVARIADKPPRYQYMSANQQFMLGKTTAEDPAYDTFAESLYMVFDNKRRLHGSEISHSYEWVEDLKLPPEVVIMLIQHMVNQHGVNFSFKAAEKKALMLAGEHVTTVEDAEQVLSRDEKLWTSCKQLLKRMGKRRNPSEDELSLYRKWLNEWHFMPDAVEAACAETTRGDPNFAYLDGILRGMHERNGDRGMTSAAEVEALKNREQDRIQPLKDVFAALHSREVINDGTLAVYIDMRAMYPHDIIMLAARECARHSGNLGDVNTVLRNWQSMNLQTEEEISQYMAVVNQRNELLKALYQQWGIRASTNAGDRKLLQKWEEEFGYGEAFVIFCAPFAAGANQPMKYLNRLLEELHKKNITTEDAAAVELKAFRERQQPASGTPRRGKVVNEQQYAQREYEEGAELQDWMKMMEDGNI